MKDFQMNLKFSSPVEKVYQAIASSNGPENWWTVFCTVDSSVGGQADFRFPQADFFATMRITKLKPDKLVEWECIDGKHPEETGYSDLRDWVGTTIRFEIEPDGNDKSVLHFTHVGLNERLECYDSCESGWNFYLNESLRSYVETGVGNPFDKDVKTAV